MPAIGRLDSRFFLGGGDFDKAAAHPKEVDRGPSSAKVEFHDENAFRGGRRPCFLFLPLPHDLCGGIKSSDCVKDFHAERRSSNSNRQVRNISKRQTPRDSSVAWRRRDFARRT